MSELIEIPITRGFVAKSAITAIRLADASKAEFEGPDHLPRVIIDTQQMVGAFVISCDSVDARDGVYVQIADQIRKEEPDSIGHAIRALLNRRRRNRAKASHR